MSQINRRAVLGGAVGAAAGLFTTGGRMALLQAAGGREDAPRPCPPTAWHKHGIALEATEPWEGDDIQSFTSPAEPLGADRWRIWYSARAPKKGFTIAYADGTPGQPMTKVPAVCTPGEPGDGAFTIGNLPEKWKPTQVVHVPLRGGKHRIYFWAHGPEILRYLAADSDDGRRYRVVNVNRPVLYHPSDRAALGIASPDGMSFKASKDTTRPAGEAPAPSRLISNDATNVYQLADGSFELYSVGLVPVPKSDPAYMPHDNAPGLLRMIDRYTSEDGLHFENRQRIIRRDGQDPVDQQFYYLAVTYTSKGRVGMLGHYRLEAQTMDLEWCFSKDGLKWDRPQRSAWLARGDRTQPDSYGIYAPSALAEHDGRWHLFYTGVNSSHNGKDSHGKPRSVIMHATTESIWA